MDQIFRLLSMFVMLFNICNQSDFNRQQCMKDWDVWLYPELISGWNLYTEKEKPYQREKEILEDINN
jgi:hypothetical protein